MVAKRPLSPAYQRRIERALAKGKTLQQARGHKAREHVERKEKERAKNFGLTYDEERRIRDWAIRRAFEIHDSHSDPQEFVEYFQAHGYEGFKQYRQVWDQTRRAYIRNEKQPLGLSLENLTGRAGIEDLSWMYYH